MKSLDTDLETLCGDLERLDYVVVKHGDFVCVRLPLITSIRVHHTPENGFRFVPQVGPLKRGTALWLTSGGSLAAVGAAAATLGLTPLTFVLGFLGVIALAHDACRFVLSEGCLTRLQQLIAARGATRSPLTSGARPMLPDSAQFTYLDQRAADTASVPR